ncbi:MAG TPA: glutathione S-transferase [Stellaceae bacterium]|nr:glutathione S-transferase [Stellaceae bacterium]
MRYELYYWAGIQGRGEFVRLALEEAEAEYVDIARQTGGEAAMMRLLGGQCPDHLPFAPPFLKAGELIVGQTANILLYLGAHHGLAPADEAGRLWAHQLQLTIADFVDEAHDTHHPIASSLYYKDQRPQARARATDFLKSRAPKYLSYFERVLERNATGTTHLVGAELTYPDLSLFQMLAGLRYAFPRAMARLEPKHPRVVAVHDRVAARPRIAAYLASDRRIPFNEHGIFRHYPELDSEA